MGNIDDFLAHYGVKGMRWGVIRDRDSSSSGSKSDNKSGGRPPNKKDVEKAANALNDYAVKNGFSSEGMAARYGPSSMKDTKPPPKDDRSFYQRHKTAIQVGAGVAVVGLAAYGGYKYNNHLKDQAIVKAGKKQADAIAKNNADDAAREAKFAAQKKQWAEDDAVADSVAAAKLAKGQSLNALMKDYTNLSNQRMLTFNPDALDNTPINIKRGTIFKRVSTEPETSIKSTGFFASYEDDDVERYKAILPTFWPKWGHYKNAGYVVNIQADSDIKAPSPKKAYDMYRELLDDKTFRAALDPDGALAGQSSDAIARSSYLQMALAWNSPELPAVKMYMDKVKSSGYNALLDQNDAGLLAKSPMRLLDGNMFTIKGSDPLSASDISSAQISEAKKLGLK